MSPRWGPTKPLLPDEQSGPGKAIRQTLNALAGKKDLRPTGTLIVQLESFTFEDTNLESPLSSFLRDQAAFALVRSKSFSLAVPAQDQDRSVASDPGRDPKGILSAKFYRKGDTLLVDIMVVENDTMRGQNASGNSVVGTRLD